MYTLNKPYTFGKPWSSIKKELEKDFICDSLKGRVSYFLTVYRKSHDGIENRFAILIDKKEVFQANSFNDFSKYWSLENDLYYNLNISYDDTRDFVKNVADHNYDYSTDDVFDSLLFYWQNKINNSINSDDYIVKMFAILDRRVGKRTLSKLRDELQYLPEWLQYFYKVRLDAENISYNQVH